MKTTPTIPNCRYYDLQLQSELNKPPLILVSDLRDSAVYHPARHILSDCCYDAIVNDLLDNTLGQRVIEDLIAAKVSKVARGHRGRSTGRRVHLWTITSVTIRGMAIAVTNNITCQAKRQRVM